jgi:hypothetical protein
MLLATSFGDTLFGLIILFSLGMMGLRQFLGKFDTDGSVKDAARKGIVNQISKWLK